MRYNEKINDHFHNPRNAGSLNRTLMNVGTGLVGAPACGDVMQLQIQVSEAGIIEDAKFKTFGCGSAIASSSLVTTLVIGKNIIDIAKELELPPQKIHCSVLAEDAIKAAIKNYLDKKDDAS